MDPFIWVHFDIWIFELPGVRRDGGGAARSLAANVNEVWGRIIYAFCPILGILE